MANSNDPYRRLGTNSWQELLDQVNNVLQNPPAGCDPIDTIDGPDPEHKWSKEDITEVHDTLNTMPGNCFTFQEIPDKWKVSIIEDIEDQLSNAWCDCEDCLAPCSNASPEPVITSLGTVVRSRACCAPHPEAAMWALMLEAEDEGQTAQTESNLWSLNQRRYCEALRDLHVLEAQLTALELAAAEICAIPDNEPACALAEAAVVAKQLEVDDQQDIVDAEQITLAGHLEAADSAAISSMTRANQAAGLWADCGQNLLTSVPTSIPWADTDCDQLGPECIGLNPSRCRASWSIDKKSTRVIPPPLPGDNPFWLFMSSGGFTPNGLPYYLSTVGSSCCPRPPCASECECSSSVCDDCCWNAGLQVCTAHLDEYRLRVFYNTQTEDVCC